ncbi:MAG: hypothetical protein R3208_14745, partial [Ketobacteraceae bacterium]|nr:hypothetical protein [Ketobacteraceae bacterium]
MQATQTDKVASINVQTWNDTTLTAEPVPVDPGSLADPGAWFDLLTQPQFVEARINHDAEAVTSDIVPLLAGTAGLDDIVISDQTLASGTLPSGVT